jgi:hypothetical protein
MRVKPAAGLSVRDPLTKKLLPPEGIDVPDGDILWTKMHNDGDVVIILDAIAESAQPVAVEHVDAPEGEAL